MSDLVEKVARALVQADPSINADGDLEWHFKADIARVAIVAVLEASLNEGGIVDDWLSARRWDLCLASPQEPPDAPKPLDPTPRAQDS